MTKALSKLEASIEAQNKKLAQLKAQKQKMEALIRARTSGAVRKADTRKKVLAGALLLDMMEKDAELRKQMMSRLSSFLVRSEDRALFGLRSAGE